jgi:SAM-dependent methyltransferase
LTPSARFRRDTQLLDIAEDSDDDQAALANLRFGALMTSKWLSFGRVLFSPAHNEMKLANEPKVLVLDGLGSDWSYYVALTYPAATVYNLGPAPTNGSTSWPGINQKPPANHKHYVHGNIASAFPFPKGFFTAVLFRFPIASSDAAYHACIYECKRVLRPGGHLEIAVLDLDLMNMGSRTRSVVRGLKTRMQAQESSVSLRNLSDVLIRLIGRRGFEEVQRCVVGVPVAGRIPTSQDNSSRSSGDNHLPTRTRASNEPELSFSDLLSEARNSQIEAPSEGSDEGITKMVAKVGRWWYSTCYETSLLQQGEKSIWADQALLRECQKQGTSLRLLIAHAQKPAQTRRRTVSV